MLSPGGKASDNDDSRVLDFKTIVWAAVAQAVAVGESFTANVTRAATQRKVIKDVGSPDFQHAQHQRLSPGAAKLGKVALTAVAAAKLLRNAVTGNLSQVAKILVKIYYHS